MKQHYYEANRRNRNDSNTTTPHEMEVERYLITKGIEYVKEKDKLEGTV